LATDEDTKLYMNRRLAEGKTKREVFRCLNRDPPMRFGLVDFVRR